MKPTDAGEQIYKRESHSKTIAVAPDIVMNFRTGILSAHGLNAQDRSID
jgi:hypothetical protein